MSFQQELDTLKLAVAVVVERGANFQKPDDQVAAAVAAPLVVVVLLKEAVMAALRRLEIFYGLFIRKKERASFKVITVRLITRLRFLPQVQAREALAVII
jgi:NifB/MoaA-like Fe-S oxidoreductase